VLIKLSYMTVKASILGVNGAAHRLAISR
jgi:hypothetical protein